LGNGKHIWQKNIYTPKSQRSASKKSGIIKSNCGETVTITQKLKEAAAATNYISSNLTILHEVKHIFQKFS